MVEPQGQFLQSLLSPLPYAEEAKWTIQQHLLSLFAAVPSLRPNSAVFTHNDGRTLPLLQAEGTIPIIFNNHPYNIPIILWLMDSYPLHPPLVLLNPTPHMLIKRPHPLVTPSGLVSISYLQDWLYPSSNLVELVRSLCHLFGRDPPLYSQPNASPPPPRPYPPSPYGSSAGSAVVGGGGGGGKYVNDHSSPYGSSVDDQVEGFRRSAINKLVESLYSDVGRMRKGREGEMEGLFRAQGELRRREGEVVKGVKEMEYEKEGLEQKLQMELMNADVLEGWLRENEEKVEALKGVDVDQMFEHVDVLSRQVVECTASDLAVEDTIYALDKAVQEGAIPFDQYLRNVRLLSRQQFIHRATASKVRDAQMQTQVAHMASRTQPAYMMR